MGIYIYIYLIFSFWLHDPGSDLCSLHWNYRVLNTGPSGKPQVGQYWLKIMLNNSREWSCQVCVLMTHTLQQLALLLHLGMISQSCPCSSPRPGSASWLRVLTGWTPSSSKDPICSQFCLQALSQQAASWPSPEPWGCGVHCPLNHTSLSFPRTSNIFHLLWHRLV